MFARYAPIQRKVRPSVWKDAIQRALALPEDELPTQPEGGGRHEGEGNAPKSLRVWAARHPDRLERLRRARRVVTRIADDTRTPPEIVLRPRILHNLCWQEDPAGLDVPAFLAEQGARRWQIALVAESVSRAIM